MILKSKETTIAYRCPSCGKNIMSLVGIFTLSGDLLKLKCDCGHSELHIVHTKDHKIRLTVPCLVCPNPHNFLISENAFFDRDLFTLSCTYSDVDICFIGSSDKVMEALKKSDEELMEMLNDAGIDDYDDFAAKRDFFNTDDNEDLPLLADPQIEDIIRFMLAELNEDGNIHCLCPPGAGSYDFEPVNGGVRVSCEKCGFEKIVPVNGTLSANAFLHCDGLVLERPKKETENTSEDGHSPD